VDAISSATGAGSAEGAAPIVGTWELLAVTSRGATGEVRTPFGQAKGRLVYSRSGQMSVVVTAETRITDPFAASAEDQAALYRRTIAYAGTYSFKGTEVIHHIEVSWRPDWVGVDQARTATLDGAMLTLETPPLTGDRIWTLTWRRLD